MLVSLKLLQGNWAALTELQVEPFLGLIPEGPRGDWVTPKKTSRGREEKRHTHAG